MPHDWFKARGYRHFDTAVGESFIAKSCNAAFVAKHAWLPLIHYVKREKRYKKSIGKTVYKDRPIMFASHRDACILSKYAYELGIALDNHYQSVGLSNHVIAYRKLGRANYHFSADAHRFAQAIQPCVVLCFDITGFFDHLDHGILKTRLKRLLNVEELSPDWYAVYRHVTKFSRIDRTALEAHPVFSARMNEDSREPIATIRELLDANIIPHTNPEKFGIPQGTPISSAFSNLYMMEVDAAMVACCAEIGALYQRYSDDILIICPPQAEGKITVTLKSLVASHKLEIKDEKTDRALVSLDSKDTFQYLGFNVSGTEAVIRPSSLARQWRKAKRALRTTKRIGDEAVSAGRSTKVYTKRLRRRFAPVGTRNFSKYARRASDAFGSKRIVRQVLRLERMIDAAIRELSNDKEAR